MVLLALNAMPIPVFLNRLVTFLIRGLWYVNVTHFCCFVLMCTHFHVLDEKYIGTDKAIPLQVRTVPEGSTRLRLQISRQLAHEDGKVVSENYIGCL
jgi:hypothetical protein